MNSLSRVVDGNNRFSAIGDLNKFQDSVNDMRLMIWQKFLLGIASNPNMTKKEVCNHIGLKVGTINSIQQHYKLQSPFYYRKPKNHKKKKQESDEHPQKTKKSKQRPESEVKGGGNLSDQESNDFENTFSETVKSLRIS